MDISDNGSVLEASAIRCYRSRRMKNKEFGESERLAMLRVLVAILDLTAGHPRLPPSKHAVSRPLTPLLRLALAEASRETMSVGELQRACKLTQAATSRLVAAHIKAGTMEIVQSEDARKTDLRLSKSGRAFIDEVLSLMHRALHSEGLRIR